MLRPRSPFRRAAFSMLEVIGLVAVMAILAAVVIPVLYSGVDSRAIVSTKATIDSLKAGLDTFRLRVNHYPSRIAMLSDSSLRATAPLDKNSCGADIPAGDAAAYGTGASEPFFFRVISPSGGLPVGIGIIDDAIPVRVNNLADLLFVIRGVRVDDGQALNDLIDGTAEADNPDGSNVLGNLRHPAPSANGTYTFVNAKHVGGLTDC